MSVLPMLTALLYLFSVDADDRSMWYRQPYCAGVSTDTACPLDYSPVCGTDRTTYANECALCVRRLETKANIRIVKEGPC